MSNFALVIYLIAIIASISTASSARNLALQTSYPLPSTVISMLFTLFTIIALFVGESFVFNLLWLFPLSFVVGTLSLMFPLSLLWIPGNIYQKIITIKFGKANNHTITKQTDVKIKEKNQ